MASIAPDVIKTYAEMVPPPAPGKELTDEDKAMQLKQRAEILSTAYKDVRGKLFDPNLSLFDVPDPWYKWQWSEVLGILAMAGFLSLGAPFWYNVLTNLVNLRSQVAQKQKQEEQAT